MLPSTCSDVTRLPLMLQKANIVAGPQRTGRDEAEVASEVSHLKGSAAHFCAKLVLQPVCPTANGEPCRGGGPLMSEQIAGGLNKLGFVGFVSGREADTVLKFIRRGTGLSCCGGNDTFKSKLFMFHIRAAEEKSEKLCVRSLLLHCLWVCGHRRERYGKPAGPGRAGGPEQ